MKKVNLILVALIGVTVLMSCKKDQNSGIDNIVGNYKGTLIDPVTQNNEGTATTEVTQIDDETVQIHCSGANFDTTMVINVYENSDSLMCCTHQMSSGCHKGNSNGGGMMGGGMMGGNNNKKSKNWDNHKKTMSCQNGTHNGGFDTNNNSFNYLFNMSGQNGLKFSGTKQ
ncbi:MAG: hypothetical protein A2046_05110 [Bacteroidetes bacterium GWA2_30_7]|nr:MAG: hypothetical protein A2046_05110 [Bacteroidetes bacterium GWA2_30_7]